MAINEDNPLPFKPDNIASTVTFDDLGQVAPGVVVTLHDRVISALRKAYPAWADTWHITINTADTGGVFTLRNMAISAGHGFEWRIVDVTEEKCVKAAGELFERYNIARKRGLDVNQVLAELTRDYRGRPVFFED